jgi:hypothetical protein
MSKLEEAQVVQQELEQVLYRIPESGSFESAELARQASKLTDRLISLCSQWDEEVKAGSRGPEIVASAGNL